MLCCGEGEWPTGLVGGYEVVGVACDEEVAVMEEEGEDAVRGRGG